MRVLDRRRADSGGKMSSSAPPHHTGGGRDLRSSVAVVLGKLTAGASRALGRGGGSIIGGRVILAVQPRALSTLVAGRPVSLVSGTNGKTTTTRMLTDALRTQGSVATNASGANIAAALADTVATPADQLVLEVDELYLPRVLTETRASAVVLLNLSRDQLDRMNETKAVAARWRAALATAEPPLHVIANADDPLVAWVAETAADTTWVGTSSSWSLDSAVCPECGRLLHRGPDGWFCDCGRRRPTTPYGVVNGQLETPSAVLRLALQLPGTVNAGNAALAVAAAAARGVEPAEAVSAIERVTSVGNRYRHYSVGDAAVRLLLAKNPAGWAELLSLLEPSHVTVVAINARTADGRDPSWLWDVPFEALAGRTVVAIGDRRLDLAVRLAAAGVEHQIADGLRAAMAIHPDATAVDVAANYTAFRDLALELDRAA